jgi:hypothetical protein
MTMRALPLLIPLALASCSTSQDPADDGFNNDKADGTSSSATYFACKDFATINTTWLAISRTQRFVQLTMEGVGVNTGSQVQSTSSARTYGSWSTNVFLQSHDTVVIPTSLMATGSGMITWASDGVPRWNAQCTKQEPSGDQCMPLVQQIYPVDSTATATYMRTAQGAYTVTIPDTQVGDFVYSVAMNVDGLLCTQGAVNTTSCSAVVADAISSQAYSDGASSGYPYVTAQTKTTDGYSWTGGIHDMESGEFAYAVTTDTNSDGCRVVSIKSTL